MSTDRPPRRSGPRPGALPLVPAPLHCVTRPGAPLPLAPDTRVVAVGEAEAVGTLVADRLSAQLGTQVPVTFDDGRPGAIVLRLLGGGAGAASPGAYRVQVDSMRALVTAVDLDGLRHGAVTMWQLLTPRPDGGPALRPAFVVDAPRFGWRGLHLDVARHFHGVDTVCEVLRLMSSLKLNVLHLHLTDDQGWRLEIPSRPLLTEVSGATAVDGDPGGYFTVADFAKIQAFAGRRGITVVPEIGMVGHTNAAQHAYPGLTPGGVGVPAYTGTDVGFSRLHVDLPETAAFVRDVVSDVAAMTRGPYIHIGGDEALIMGRPEYTRLVSMIAEQVRVAGKTVVGWQEITQAPLAPGTVVQFWDERPDPGPIIDAAWQGARLVMSPARHVYLDMKYDDDSPVGLDWAGNVELRDAYEWEPMEMLPGVLPGSVAGVEAALWSETVRTRDDVFTMLLPRLAAVAEVAWSVPTRRSWADFSARVARLAPEWAAAGLSWYAARQVHWRADLTH